MANTKDRATALQRLCEVLEWLYTAQGTYDTAAEWREELVNRLYWLVDEPHDVDAAFESEDEV